MGRILTLALALGLAVTLAGCGHAAVGVSLARQCG